MDARIEMIENVVMRDQIKLKSKLVKIQVD